MALLECDFFNFCGWYCCEITSQVIKDAKVKFNGRHKDLKADEDVQYLNIVACTFAEFPVNIHETFPNLQILDVFHCELEAIERRHLYKLTSLATVEFSECGLTKLKGDLFRNLKELKIISFEDNKIEEIDPSILDGLEKLASVNFRGNVNINMEYDSEEPDGNTLDELKREIKKKCKPKPTIPKKSAEESKPGSNFKEIQRLTQENAKLKLSLAKQVTLVINQRVHIKNIQAKQQKNSAIHGSLSKILKDPAFKDFTVYVGQSSFKVHKLIFAARSATLADLFRKEPKATELNLQDISEPTFKAIYEFIYNNRLPVDVDYFEVLSAAARLKMDDLKELVATRLIAKMDEGNSFDLLVLGNKFDHEELREKAFKNIRTKVFPDHKLDDELAKQPEKMKKMIEMKKLNQEFEDMLKAD